jgi:hypothetical protein
MTTIRVEEHRGRIRLCESRDGEIVREIIMAPDEAQNLFFDGLKICAALEKERVS